MRRRGMVTLAVGAFLAGGCGTDESERDARATAERFNAALARDDGAAACDELSQEAARALESDEGAPCPEAIGSLALEPAPVATTEVWITSARVDLAGGEAAFLDETDDGWRISAAGCKPRAGAPYDCELEA